MSHYIRGTILLVFAIGFWVAPLLDKNANYYISMGFGCIIYAIYSVHEIIRDKIVNKK